MYARLWWKDARQFWPIWVFLALAAAAVQGLLLYYFEHDARHGALGYSALICTSLYAFATGAAAFAGERETGTLRLLDSLSADRRVVWVSKASFAVVTTAALGLVVLGMAAMSTDEWERGRLSIVEAASGTAIILGALGWALFWSASLSNALTAAVLAICSTAASVVFLGSQFGGRYRPYDSPSFALGQLLMFLATVIASAVVFNLTTWWRRAPIEFRSPVVVTRAETATAGRAQIEASSRFAGVLAGMPAIGMLESPAVEQSLRRSWTAEVRALAWQTMREGRAVWSLLASIGLVLLLLIYSGSDNIWFSLWLIGVITMVTAGASVFGLENRARTQRFLAHHGVRPGFVWLMKLTVWAVGIALVAGPLAGVTSNSRLRREALELGMALIPLFLGVALVCGMALRRGITAVVVAIMMGALLMIPLGVLVQAKMLPIQGMLVIPAALLVVTWAWSGDWLLDRPGRGRSIRLGMLIAGALTFAVCWYAGYRAWGIRDVGAIAPPDGWAKAAASPIPADQNAAVLYLEAYGRLIGPFEESPAFLDRNREQLPQLRRAAARPYCRFSQGEKPNVIDRPDLPPVGRFALLLADDATERQNRGDLAGAWDDIIALFRMAHQVGDPMCGAPAFACVNVERIALGRALEWAVAPGQAPDRLHATLAAYRELPKPAPASEWLRAEANLVENTLELPMSRLREWALESMGSGRQRQSFEAALMVDLATMPWERVRARRVNRLVSYAAIQDAQREPWQRSRVNDHEIAYAKKTSQNAMMLIPNMAGCVFAQDQNEVARRALVQVLALRAWQLKHGGQFPESLEALVPEELPNLPKDPYSGRPFGYVRSQGLAVPPLRYPLTPAKRPSSSFGGAGARANDVRMPAKESRLLYSVGPDGHDDHGVTFKEQDHSWQPMDIVFEIPPVQNAGGADKREEPGRNPQKDR